MNRAEVQDMLLQNATRYQMTGSRYICEPAPADTDEDYVALGGGGLADALYKAGFVLNTDPEMYDALPDFMAWRLGEFNIIQVEDENFYDLFVAATEEAKALNLLAKDDRIALFQRVLYGAPALEVFP